MLMIFLYLYYYMWAHLNSSNVKSLLFFPTYHGSVFEENKIKDIFICNSKSYVFVFLS